MKRLLKYKKILWYMDKIVLNVLMHIGSVLIITCGLILIFSGVNNYLGLKLGVAGLSMVFCSSVVGEIGDILSSKINNKLNRIKKHNHVIVNKDKKKSNNKKYDYKFDNDICKNYNVGCEYVNTKVRKRTR